MEKETPVIELKEVSRTYPMGDTLVYALKGIDLLIEKGEYVSIMGPSGSGKSTLMNIIGCLDRPDGGAYWLNGLRVDEMTDDELAGVRNRSIGFVFQTFNLLSRQTAIENVILPMLYMGVKDPAPRAVEALKDVGLEHRLNHRPNELSGGERQRVAIARALVNNPSIILADEPTGNLDMKTGREIMDIMDGLHSRGSTIVLVTHELDVADHSDRIVTIRDGRVIGAGG